jgi:hypothetical protein
MVGVDGQLLAVVFTDGRCKLRRFEPPLRRRLIGKAVVWRKT